MTISPKYAKLALTALATFAATLGMAATAHADAPINLPVTDTVRTQLVEVGGCSAPLPSTIIAMWGWDATWCKPHRELLRLASEGLGAR